MVNVIASASNTINIILEDRSCQLKDFYIEKYDRQYNKLFTLWVSYFYFFIWS